MEQAWSEDKQTIFPKSFAGHQTDLKLNSKRYWQPIKGKQQWNTASKWRLVHHNSVSSQGP